MSQNIQIRVTESEKKEVEAIFKELGLTTSQAIKLFLKQVQIHQGLPFDVQLKKFNKDTLESFTDLDERKMTFKELKELMNKL